MLVGDSIDEVLGERGWQQVSALATLQATWPEVVGADLADHLTVESLDDRVLLVRADSTAWATQVELMLPVLTEQVQGAVGAEAVRSVRVRGPQGPSWVAGPRRVKGRGPRDTYG
jgi:predicted nucleic acid-binding Zn ribbon protein